MKSKWFRSIAVITVMGLSLTFGTSCTGTKTVKIGAILAVTGPAAYLGGPEEKTLKMMAEEYNKNGGINGQKVELIIKDTASKSENALSFAKQLIEEDGIVAIIGPSTSGETMAIKDLCEKEKVPLISCAAAETIVDPQAHYVFKTPQKDSYVVKWIFDSMKKRGITKVGVLAMGTGLAIKGFTVAIFGGFGNSTGALLGGLILGILESFAIVVFPEAYKNIITIAILLLVLFIRPSGLLGAKKSWTITRHTGDMEV